MMTISLELAISVIIQLIAVGVFIGVYKTTINFMQANIKKLEETLKEDKKELKEEMHKYNNVLERMIRVEDSVKSAHSRLDDLREIS